MNGTTKHVEIKEIKEGYYWWKGEMVIFDSGMTFHVAQGPFIEEGVQEKDLNPIGYLLRTRRPPMQITPDELIKPLEALEMFSKEKREDNAEPVRTMPEYTALYSFVSWLAKNHLVIIKDPTR